MKLIRLVKQVLKFYMATVVGIINRHDLNIDVHCRNQLNKLVL